VGAISGGSDASGVSGIHVQVVYVESWTWSLYLFIGFILAIGLYLFFTGSFKGVYKNGGEVYMRNLNIAETLLLISLVVALVCSIWIAYFVYVRRDRHYSEGFSTWQMPMIFAILADLYLMR
jgi:cytochrome bd-type quinol oxidase subunit 2